MGVVRRTADDYREALRALLPQGPAWTRDPDRSDALDRLLHGLADGIERFDGDVNDLVDESDPRTTDELLSDWERAFGLPDPCATPPSTDDERRAALTAKVTARGGQSPDYIVEVAARLGYTVTIIEYDPFIAGVQAVSSKTGDKVYSFDYNFTFTVDVSAEAANAVSHALFECAINRIKPAHTLALYSYPP